MDDSEKTAVLLVSSFISPGSSCAACITDLARILVTETPEGISIRTPYCYTLIDALEKFGSMLYERDQVRRAEGRHRHGETTEHREMKHHVYCFIFFTGAFLDSIASLLNVEHSLKFKRNAVSLRREKFRCALACEAPELAAAVCRHEGWSDEVARFRDNVIHRHSIAILPGVDPEIGDRGYRSWRYKIQTDPDFPAFSRQARRSVNCFVEDFSNEWFAHASSLLEDVCEHLVERNRGVVADGAGEG